LDAREAFGKCRCRRAPSGASVPRRPPRGGAGGDEDALPVELNRLIVHPLFRNVSFQRAERELGGKPVGSVMFRPSSKGTDFLTLTWFFLGRPAADLCAHRIHESEKGENAAALGKKLTIDGAPFADINEISARYVEPMNDLVRRMLAFDKFSTLSARDAAKKLESDKNANPESIPYLLRVSDEHAGPLRAHVPGGARQQAAPRDCHAVARRLSPATQGVWRAARAHQLVQAQLAQADQAPPGAAGRAAAGIVGGGFVDVDAASAVAALSSTLAQLSATGPLGPRGRCERRHRGRRARAPLPTPSLRRRRSERAACRARRRRGPTCAPCGWISRRQRT
jgi:hypothetical protein